MRDPSLRRELERVDVTAGGSDLPASLVETIESEGGLWAASDFYTETETVIERALEVGAVALRWALARDHPLREEWHRAMSG